jgi:hypothetical protein
VKDVVAQVMQRRCRFSSLLIPLCRHLSVTSRSLTVLRGILCLDSRSLCLPVPVTPRPSSTTSWAMGCRTSASSRQHSITFILQLHFHRLVQVRR